MVGSEGTLGVVTEAYLKIIPIPTAQTRRLLLTFDDWRSAGDAICGLRSAKIMPHMFEFLDKEAIQALNEKLHMDQDEAEATLIVDIEEASLEAAMEIFNAASLPRVLMAKDDEEAEAFYQIRSMAYLAIRDLAPAVQVEDIAVPIDRLAEYLDEGEGGGLQVRPEDPGERPRGRWERPPCHPLRQGTTRRAARRPTTPSRRYAATG